MLAPICDFCCSPEVRWSEWSDKFLVHVVGPKGVLDFESDAQWAACDPCEQLILEGDQDGLLQRSLVGHQLCYDRIVPEEDRTLSMTLIRSLQEKFFETRRGTPTPWEGE